MSDINWSWSVYQRQCFDWIERAIIEDNNDLLCLVIEAVAGSGKTTVLKEMIRRILTMIDKHQVKDLSILSTAFGKANAKELRKAIDSIGLGSNINVLARKVHTKTLHGLARGALIRGLNTRISRNGGRDNGLMLGNTDSGFNWKIQHLILGSQKRGVSPVVFQVDDYDPAKYTMELISLVGKIKAHGYAPSYAINEATEAARIKWCVDNINETTIRELIEMYTIERFYDVPVSVVNHWANAIVKASIKQAQEIIDFDDMLYITAIFNFPFAKYDIVMIDEAQDISHVQRRIIHKLRKNGTILIAVGDSAQAIYMFRGAASNSMDLFRDEFNAQDADLPICYRCAKSIEPLVTSHVPKFRVFEGNCDGIVVKTLDTVNVPGMVPVASKTLILCRNNAPLLKTAYNLLANNVPVSMMGVDLAAGLVGLIDAVTKGITKDAATFRGMLENYITEKKTKAAENGYKANFSKLDDETECLGIVLDNAIINGREVRTTDELKQAIAYLMRNKDGVKLSSIHRAKGFEADGVYIIERETANDDAFIPSKYAITDEQLRQEQNLYYVAVTRMKKRLYFVSVDAFAA